MASSAKMKRACWCRPMPWVSCGELRSRRCCSSWAIYRWCAWGDLDRPVGGLPSGLWRHGRAGPDHHCRAAAGQSANVPRRAPRAEGTGPPRSAAVGAGGRCHVCAPHLCGACAGRDHACQSRLRGLRSGTDRHRFHIGRLVAGRCCQDHLGVAGHRHGPAAAAHDHAPGAAIGLVAWARRPLASCCPCRCGSCRPRASSVNVGAFNQGNAVGAASLRGVGLPLTSAPAPAASGPAP